MEARIFAAGAGAYVGGKASHAITGLDMDAVENLGTSLMGGGAFLAGLKLLGEFGSVIMDHEGLQHYDVRHDTPERRAAIRSGTAAMMQSMEGPEVPTDDVDRVALQERFIKAMQQVTSPKDPCGWYRFGWDMHNALMERILDNSGLATALALATSNQDGPQLMRLASIPQGEVHCNRFWFGFRDANHSMADQMVWLAGPDPGLGST